jgi:hypothetical protein
MHMHTGKRQTSTTDCSLWDKPNQSVTKVIGGGGEIWRLASTVQLDKSPCGA